MGTTNPSHGNSDMHSSNLVRALVLGLVILGLALFAGPLTRGTRQPASPPPTTAPSVPGIAIDLERVGTFPGPGGSAATGVTAGGPGFVAVGFDGTDRAMVWVSTDGLSWTAVPDDEAFARASMSGVTAARGRLIAVGRDLTDIEHDVAAAWTSEDGIRWRRIVEPSLDGAQMIGVIPGGPGFIAVGTRLEGMDASAVWTSLDGEAWDLVPSSPDFAHSFIWSVARGSKGLVATGWHRRPEPGVAFWSSADGRSWERSDPPPDSEGFQARSVVDLDGRLVAVGDRVTGGAGAVWSSPDGVTWQRVPGPPTFDDATLTAITRIPGGVILAGQLGIDAAAWTSPDGETWSSLVDRHAFDGAYITALALGGERLVAVGATQERIAGTDSYNQAATAWSSSPFAGATR